MIRPVLTEVGIFLIPFAVYALFLIATRSGVLAQSSWPAHLIAKLVLGSLLLVIINLSGMFPGYASFGWVADWLGRRRSFILYTLAAALLVPLYATVTSPLMLVLIGTALLTLPAGAWAPVQFRLPDGRAAVATGR